MCVSLRLVSVMDVVNHWSFTLDHERFTGQKVQCSAFGNNKIHFNSHC